MAWHALPPSTARHMATIHRPVLPVLYRYLHRYSILLYSQSGKMSQPKILLYGTDLSKKYRFWVRGQDQEVDEVIYHDQKLYRTSGGASVHCEVEYP